MRTAVIIPTYNEAGAIGSLIDELFAMFAHKPEHEWFVVIVDANSPDGTANIIRVKQRLYPNLRLIVEQHKRGIAAAYIEGMRFAVDELGADVFVEFDGDGQHNPHDIPRLVDGIEEGYDYVIGSRYVKGGGIPKEWATYRKILSRFGSLYARLLLEIPVHDTTSGLKATRVSTLARYLPLRGEGLLSKQYAYKLQFMYEATLHKARMKEVPIQFRMREHDISKSAWYDILESLRVTFLLRVHTLWRWRFLRVVMVGGIGFLFQAALFEIVGIQLRLLDPSTVVLVAGELAVCTNFFMHEHFSFRDKRTDSAPMLHRITRFQILSLGSVLTQWVCVQTAELAFGHAPMVLRGAYVLGVGIGLLIMYTGSYFWVWGRETHA